MAPAKTGYLPSTVIPSEDGIHVEHISESFDLGFAALLRNRHPTRRNHLIPGGMNPVAYFSLSHVTGPKGIAASLINQVETIEFPGPWIPFFNGMTD